MVMRMRCPQRADPAVNHPSLAQRFVPNIVLLILRGQHRRSHVDNRRVPLQLFLQRGPGRFEKAVLIPRPIRQTIHRASVANHHPGIRIMSRQLLHLPLNPENRSLRRLQPRYARNPRKSAPENNTRGLRNKHHVAAQIQPGEFQNRRLSAAWSARQHHQTRTMSRLLTAARMCPNRKRIHHPRS